MLEHLTIPDALLDWAHGAIKHPWAHEVTMLARQSDERPLNRKETERLLCRLEGICCAAVRANRPDLLLGLDLFTAEWLRLRYRFELPNGRSVEVGGHEWSYQEVRLLLAAPEPVEARNAAVKAKALLAETFPAARVSSVMGERAACTGCGTTEAHAMIGLDTGSEYCGACYREMMAPWPKFDERGRRVVE